EYCDITITIATPSPHVRCLLKSDSHGNLSGFVLSGGQKESAAGNRPANRILEKSSLTVKFDSARQSHCRQDRRIIPTRAGLPPEILQNDVAQFLKGYAPPAYLQSYH